MISSLIIKFVGWVIAISFMASICYLTHGAIKTKSIYLIGLYVLIWLMIIALGLQLIGL